VTTVVGWDTETELIRPGVQAPELACLSLCSSVTREPDKHPSEWPALLFDSFDASGVLAKLLARDGVTLVGHNVGFDFAVMCQHDPSLIPLVFRAYNEDRVTDTEIRQRLLDIAAGKFRKELKTRSDGSSYWVVNNYDLDSVAKRNLGWRLEKDTWRLKYGSLRGIPLEQWPEEARIYPLHDARATLGIYFSQEEHAALLQDQYRQARRDFWFRLMSNWGLRTNPIGVEAFAKGVDSRMAELQSALEAYGFARKDGSRNTKAAAAHMVKVCQAAGISIVATDTQEKKNKAGAVWDLSTLKGVCLDADSCERTEDPALKLYAEFSTLMTVQSKDLKMLRQGSSLPIHSRFQLIETGRSSSSGPNVQNVRRLPGIRECFVPREGYVYGQADYPGLELRTLAQSCIWLVGQSELARFLNSDPDADPHMMVAAQLLHTTYEHAKANSKDKEVKQARQAAKVANFGFPGGLGFKALVDFARATYGVIITEDEARHLKQKWLSTWPEMSSYFDAVSSMCSGDGGLGFIEQLGGCKRYRGSVRYTAACNTFFQGLGADATSEAGWYIASEMYDPTRKSILFGSRLVNYVHDEFIIEVRRDEQASAKVRRMCELMVAGANRWVPDVPFSLAMEAFREPVLMSHWSKDAKSLVDANGNIQVWEGTA